MFFARYGPLEPELQVLDLELAGQGSNFALSLFRRPRQSPWKYQCRTPTREVQPRRRWLAASQERTLWFCARCLECDGVGGWDSRFLGELARFQRHRERSIQLLIGGVLQGIATSVGVELLMELARERAGPKLREAEGMVLTQELYDGRVMSTRGISPGSLVRTRNADGPIRHHSCRSERWPKRCLSRPPL